MNCYPYIVRPLARLCSLDNTGKLAGNYQQFRPKSRSQYTMSFRDGFGRLPACPIYGPDTHASISTKAGSSDFHPLINYKYHDCRSQHFVRDFFDTSGFGPESSADIDILEGLALPCPITTRRTSGTGPVGNTPFTGTVDSRYTIGDQVVLIVEHKRLCTITNRWASSTMLATLSGTS